MANIFNNERISDLFGSRIYAVCSIMKIKETTESFILFSLDSNIFYHDDQFLF